MNKHDVKIKSKYIGMSSLVIFLISLEIFYLFSIFERGLFVHYGYSFDSLSSLSQPAILTFMFAIISISLFLIAYGFMLRKLWVRKFTMVFLVWSMIWPIWGIIEMNQVLLNAIILVIFADMIVFLMSDYVKEFFISGEFKFRGFTLYEKEIVLKNGHVSVIRFFAKSNPKSGVPARLPEGYEVRVCSRTRLPYVQKIGAPVYTHGRYTLYKRVVKSKNGTKKPVYFFSVKKPKKGIPSRIPHRYRVEETRSKHVPYLVRRGAHHS